MTLDERGSFEREMRALSHGSRGPAREYEKLAAPPFSACIQWDAPGGDAIAGVSTGKLIDPQTKVASSVIALFFEGQTREVAVVLGGVHGSEPSGVRTTKALVAAMRKEYKAAAARPKLSVLVIPNLFAVKVTAKNEFGEVDGTRPATSPSKRQVEPNRSLPRPGESYRDVENRKPQLFDPDQRRFPKQSPLDAVKALGKKTDLVSDELLPENRALVHAIGCVKPSRLVSVHDHSAKRPARGDEAGGFVDPRGGFDSVIDAPFTPEGRDDDLSTERLLQATLMQLRAVPAKKLRDKLLARAFRGNLFDSATSSFETVHYSFTAARVRGTSLGMWGPVAVASDARPAMLTITVENPQGDPGKTGLPALKAAELQTIAEAWASAIRGVFLEGL